MRRDTALSVHGLCKSFGGLRAVHEVSLQVREGEILSIIGPNGAGKTTLFNCLSGIYRPDRGEVVLDQANIEGKPAHLICRSGLARTFQNIRLFAEMTALENVLASQVQALRPGFLDILLHTPRFHRRESDAFASARQSLAQVGLSAQEHSLARSLAYGLQRRLEIARALATRPKVLLLDEPGAGMNPKEVGEIAQIILDLKSAGLAIVLIEHHMKVVMSISDRILVLDHGEPIAEGPPEQIRQHPAVIAAYLGAEAAHGQREDPC